MKQLQNGEFKLTFKALASERDNESPFAGEDAPMRIRGLASGLGVDLHNEAMTESALRAFKQAIQDGIVLPNGEWSMIPLRSGHRNNWDDILGWLTKAELDADNNLWVEAELDSDSSRARDLYNKLTRPSKPGRVVQLGLSVGGKITKYRDVFDSALNKMVRHLEGVVLDEISVVGAPAYPTAYVTALAKSLERIEPSDEDKENNDMEDENKVTSELADDMAKEAGEVQDEQPQAEAEVADEKDEAVEAESVNEHAEVEASDASDSDNAADQPAVEKSEEADADPQPQDVVMDRIAELAKQMGDLAQAIADLRAERNVEDMSKSGEAEADADAEVVEKAADVEEAVDVTEPTDVHKSLDEDRVKEIVASVMAESMGELVDQIKLIKSEVTEIASTPADASLSVRKAKEDEEKSPLDLFKSRLAATDGQKPVSPLRAAIQASLDSK